MIALRAASPTYAPPKGVTCLSRVGNALVANAQFVVSLSDACVYVYSAGALLEQGKLKRSGLRCCALADRALLVVDEARWEIVLLSTAMPARPPALLHRQDIFFLASDCAIVETATAQLVVALAGPSGLQLTSVSRPPPTRNGNAANSVAPAELMLFRRSSMACCALTATHLGAACVDGHIAVVSLSRALQAGIVRDDEFAAYLPSEQRPTHCCFAPSGRVFVCVSWDGTVVLVTRAADSNGADDDWSASRLIPYLAFDRARVGPPAFALPVGDDNVVVVRGAFVGRTQLPGDERAIGAALFEGHLLVLDRAHSLHAALLDETQPSSFVCAGLSARDAQLAMAPILPDDCVAFCDDARNVAPPCKWCCQPGDFIVAAYGRALVAYIVATSQHVVAELHVPPLAMAHDERGCIFLLLWIDSSSVVLQARDARTLRVLGADVAVPAIDGAKCAGNRCALAVHNENSARFTCAAAQLSVTIALPPV